MKKIFAALALLSASMLVLNPYTGSCVEENVEILVWEKFIRVNGQYFQTTNATSVHTD